MRLRNVIGAGLLAAGLLTSPVLARSVVEAPRVSTYELNVVNNASSDIKHIYAVNSTGDSLGDVLRGRIVKRTSAVVDLGGPDDPCGIHKGKPAYYTLRAVFYDGREATIRGDICTAAAWSIEDEELAD